NIVLHADHRKVPSGHRLRSVCRLNLESGEGNRTNGQDHNRLLGLCNNGRRVLRRLGRVGAGDGHCHCVEGREASGYLRLLLGKTEGIDVRSQYDIVKDWALLSDDEAMEAEIEGTARTLPRRSPSVPWKCLAIVKMPNIDSGSICF
ncbi:hypothetical protein, partial [Mesorhizobium sp.]|uniref:hypothetical protein n=1 Tax=Mesorhizobium sp. TaxID=1871066 RepID=UPI0025C395A4